MSVIFPAHKVKMPTTVGILTFMSRKNYMLSRIEQENLFLTSGLIVLAAVARPNLTSAAHIRIRQSYSASFFLAPLHGHVQDRPSAHIHSKKLRFPTFRIHERLSAHIRYFYLSLATYISNRTFSVFDPAGIWGQNDVVSTSMRRNHVASTLTRRHFRTKCPLGSYIPVLNI